MDTRLTIANRPTAQRQVADHFRRLIQSGALAPGSRLPTQNVLRRQLGVSGTTVHFAFQALVREGLLVARRARGTFVAEHPPGLRRLGLLYADQALIHPQNHYLRALHSSLLGCCRDRGLACAIFQNSRPESADVPPPRVLADAVAERRIEALIVPSADLPVLERLGHLDIPIAWHSSAAIGNAVAFDVRQFVDLALAELQAAGCRTVGLISGLPTQVKLNPFGGTHAHVEFTRHFIDRIGDLGMVIRNGWMREPHEEDEVRDRQVSHEAYGYELAQALLAESELPDGLVVYPDSVARGVIMALLTQPQRTAKINLVLHKNAEVPLLCPLPARFIVSSADEVARELLAMAERQFNVRPPGGPVQVPFHVGSHAEATRDAGLASLS